MDSSALLEEARSYASYSDGNHDRMYDLYRKGNSLLQMLVSAITLVLVFSLCAGFLTQTLLNIITLRGPERTLHVLTIWLFPVIIIVMALLLHGLVRIVADSMKSPPFQGLRASIIAGECLTRDTTVDCDTSLEHLECDGERIELFETIWFNWAFALMSVIGGLLSCERSGFSPAEVWAGCISGAILWTLINLLIYLLQGVSLRCVHGDAHVKASMIKRTLKALNIWPGQPISQADFDSKLNKEFLKFWDGQNLHRDRRLQSAKERDPAAIFCGNWFYNLVGLSPEKELTLGKVKQPSLSTFPAQSGGSFSSEGSHGRRSSSRHCCYFASHCCHGIGAIPLLLLGVLVWVIVYSLTAWMGDSQWFIAWNGGKADDSGFIFFTAPLLLVSVFFLFYAILELHPPFRKCTSFHAFLALVFAFVFLLYTGCIWVNGQLYQQNIDPIMSTVVQNQSGYAWEGDEKPLSPIWHNMITSPYPACSMRWLGDLSVMDLAPLAYYSYAYNESQYDYLLEEGFAHAGGIDSVERVWMDNYTHAKETGLPRVVATLFNRGKVGREGIVVAVKGTDLVRDAYADFALYTSIFVLQLGSFLIPVLDMLPNWFFAHVLAWFRAPLTVSTENALFWHVAHKVLELQANHPSASIMMTGHSLGGGIAAAIGGQMEIPSVVFSAPGAHFSRERFKTSLERQYRNVVNIRPDSDYVGRVDRNDEIVQSIECRSRNGKYDSFPACHSVVRTTCELWRACGDPRSRDFGRTCVQFVKESNLGGYFSGTDKPTLQTNETGFHPDSETSAIHAES